MASVEEGGGGSSTSPFLEEEELTPIDDYDVEGGKLRASLRWLVAKVYGASPPDQLSCVDEVAGLDSAGRRQLRPALLYSLTSGELYCAATAKIFGDQGFLEAGLGNVLAALRRCGLSLLLEEEGAEVTETILAQSAPLKLPAHLALMDALQTAHFRSVVSVEGVVGAVKRFAPVARNESPLDAEDALLFWVNKVCGAVRDAEERRVGEAPLIPEMEDLYEDLCDGAALATLIHFYAPQALPLSRICLNEPMGIADYVYNLSLVRESLERALPAPSPCHFQLEEFMYLHESLKPNVKALFADLFLALGGAVAGAGATSPSASTSRTFTTTQKTLEKMIPNLRNSAPPPAPSAGARMKRPTTTTGASSLLNSLDSLMTTRSGDSLRYQSYKAKANGSSGLGVKKSPTTSFVAQKSPDQSSESGNFNGAEDYRRSDSMPSGAASASVRLALEEKRRQHATQRQHLNAQISASRQQTGKEAFFSLMGKPSSSSSAAASNASLSGTPKAADKIHSSPSHPSQDLSNFKKSVQHLEAEVQRLTMEQERMRSEQAAAAAVAAVTETPPGRRSMSNLHLYGGSLPQAQPPSAPVYAVPNQVFPSQPPPPFQAANPSPPVQQQPLPPLQPRLHGFQTPEPQLDSSGDGSFRLHDDAEPPSRLDPALQLSRNLTNWGMTYKVSGKPARRTWNSEMFRAALPNQGPGMLPLPHAAEPRNMAASFHPASAQEQLWAQQAAQAQHQQQLQQQQQQHQLLLQQQQQHLLSMAPPQPPQHQQQQMEAPQPSPTYLSTPPHSAHANASASSEQFTPWLAESTGLGPESSSTPPLAPTFSHMEPQEAPILHKTPKAELPTRQESREKEKEASPGVGFIVGDSAEERKKNEEMASRRQALLEAQLRRKAEAEAKRAGAEADAARRRAAEEAKERDAEQRKAKAEERRQRLFQAYQAKKADEEAEKNPSPTPRTASQSRLARGHSQPPRPKSVAPRARAGGTPDGPGSMEQGLNRLAPPQLPESLQEPKLKVFVKPTAKSNRGLILNSINYCTLAGGVHREQREKVLAELAKSDAKHFLVLFRDGNRMQFRGLYSWDETGDTAYRLAGTGPKICSETIMDLMFKYDSGAKQFQNVPTRHLSATIDGFTIKDEFWAKKKAGGPYATAASQRRLSSLQ